MPRFSKPKQERKCRTSTILLTALAAAALAMMYFSAKVSSIINLNNETLERSKSLAKNQHNVRKEKAILPVLVKAYYLNDECQGGQNMTMVQALPAKPGTINFDQGMPRSIRVVGEGELRLFDDNGNYIASIVELEGTCVPIYDWPKFTRGQLTHGAPPRRIDPAVQKKFFTGTDLSKPQTRVVFSCESSIYFGYQTVTSAFAFLQSNQTNASWLRLLSAQMPDDLSERLPTFTGPRTLYSKRYSPINKPDIIDKWMNSKQDAPNPEDTIVVIDPDNWLLKDVNEWASKVSRKHAIGQAAYYHGNPNVQKLWQLVCKKGCNNTVAHVGVPYVLKAADLKEVAPLWRKYTMLLNEMRQDEKTKAQFEKGGEFGSLYISWTSEMYGYNFACAHLGIETDTVHDLQIRDVDGRVSQQQNEKKAMIHMGRAWFPKKEAALAEKWRHTEGKDFNHFGIQVWCKCNRTGHEIMPWPVPDGLDFQSYHTLRLLHEAKEWYGPIPENTTYRPQNQDSMK